MKCRECYEGFKTINRNTNATCTVLKMKDVADSDRLDSLVSQLKACDLEFLVKYRDVWRQYHELWVIVVCGVNRIGCNGDQSLLFAYRSDEKYMQSE